MSPHGQILSCKAVHPRNMIVDAVEMESGSWNFPGRCLLMKSMAACKVEHDLSMERCCHNQKNKSYVSNITVAVEPLAIIDLTFNAGTHTQQKYSSKAKPL